MSTTSINPLSGSVNPLSGSAGGSSSAAAAPRLRPIDPVRIMRQYAVLLVIWAIASVVIATATWYFWRKFWPTYATETLLLTNSGVDEPYATPRSPDLTTSSLDSTSAFIRNQALRMRSEEVIVELLQDPQLRKTEWFRSFYRPEFQDPTPLPSGELAQAERDSYNALVKEAAEVNRVRADVAKEYLQKDGLAADQVRGSTMVSVKLYAINPKNPDELNNVLDTLVGIYRRRVTQDYEQRAISVRTTMTGRKERANQDLKVVQERLQAFIRENDLGTLQPQAHEASIAYTMLADQEARYRIVAQSSRDSFEAMLKRQAEGRYVVTPDIISAAESYSAVAQRDEKVRSLREDREVMLSRTGPNHREVQRLEQAIKAAEEERQGVLDSTVQDLMNMRLADSRNRAESLEAEHESVIPKLNEARAKMNDLTLKLKQYNDIQDESKSATERAQKADEVLESIEIITDRKDSVSVAIVQSAVEAKLVTPLAVVVVPLVSFMLFSLMAGGIFLKETLDQRIKIPTDVRLVPGMELLGVLPEAAEDPSGTAQVEYVVEKDPAGLMAESFRQLRSAVLARMDRRGYKTLMVVSAQPASGVSVVVHNLAVSLAHDGRRVLVVDANFRRPRQHVFSGLNSQPGLVDVLRGSVPVEEAVAHKNEPDFDLLPAGAASDAPPELLGGSAFRSLIAQLEQRFDVVLIDAPPALLVSDAQMLAKHADAIMVVVRANTEKRGTISRMVRILEGHRADLLGIVLNGARSSAGGYFRKSYRDFYRYRGSSQSGATSTAAVTRKRGTGPTTKA